MEEKREEIINECFGCNYTEGSFCRIYGFPQHKWRMCECPSATHIKKETEKQKTRIGQQKQKKKK